MIQSGHVVALEWKAAPRHHAGYVAHAKHISPGPCIWTLVDRPASDGSELFRMSGQMRRIYSSCWKDFGCRASIEQSPVFSSLNSLFSDLLTILSTGPVFTPGRRRHICVTSAGPQPAFFCPLARLSSLPVSFAQAGARVQPGRIGRWRRLKSWYSQPRRWPIIYDSIRCAR
jgi:hypothetical protein